MATAVMGQGLGVRRNGKENGNNHTAQRFRAQKFTGGLLVQGQLESKTCQEGSWK